MTKCLRPVVLIMKSHSLDEMIHTHLKQTSITRLFMSRPMGCLTNRTTIRSDFASSTFVGAGFGTSRIRTGFHDCVTHVCKTEEGMMHTTNSGSNCCVTFSPICEKTLSIPPSFSPRGEKSFHKSPILKADLSVIGEHRRFVKTFFT